MSLGVICLYHPRIRDQSMKPVQNGNAVLPTSGVTLQQKMALCSRLLEAYTPRSLLDLCLPGARYPPGCIMRFLKVDTELYTYRCHKHKHSGYSTALFALQEITDMHIW